jgi:hypothetical protein
MIKDRAPLAYLTAYLQMTIAIILLLGYFVIIGIIIAGRAQIPDNLLELTKTLAIILTNAIGLMIAFLYLRQRTDGTPDPATTTTVSTTQQTTAPTVPPPAGQPPLAPPPVPVIPPVPGVLK